MKLFFYICMAFTTLNLSCQENSYVTGSGVTGNFTYQSYDTLGNLIVRGWIEIETIDSTHIEGRWQLEKLVNQDDTGPQSGDGKLSGSINDSLIFIDLNPQYRDNNIILSGVVKEKIIEGKWTWVSYIGPTNQGTFRAVKN